jgi:hypothetical protein
LQKGLFCLLVVSKGAVLAFQNGLFWLFKRGCLAISKGDVLRQHHFIVAH